MISPIIPTTTKVLSALDNESSLWPLLVKDMIDNTGRSFAEYNRGGNGAQHAGRERAIEEFSTTAVWLGGRKALNLWIIDPVMRACGLDPKVDMALFLKNKGVQAVPAWIAKKKDVYLTANILKFLVGTLVPVAIIGWCIPTVNQAITRFKVTQERNLQQQKAIAYNPYNYRRYSQTPYAQMPRFQGLNPKLLESAANLINNDLYGNIAIDMGISGGRLYKARNWVDRLETAVREGSIVLFLYFLGDFVKHHIKQYFDKTLKTVTGLTFHSIEWLKKKGQQISPAQWRQETDFLKNLKPNEAFTTIANLLNPQTGRFDSNPILELARLQGKIDVISPQETLSLEHARKIFGQNLANEQHQFVLDPRKYLDINAIKQGQKGLINQLFKSVDENRYASQLLGSLERTSRYKMIAMLSSYAVSAVCVAWLTPKFQHWLTYRLTGKVDFPGTRTDVHFQ